jgi:hypothetical protein
MIDIYYQSDGIFKEGENYWNHKTLPSSLSILSLAKDREEKITEAMVIERVIKALKSDK